MTSAVKPTEADAPEAALLPSAQAPRSSSLGRATINVRRYARGVWTAVIISFAATFVAEHHGGPQLLYALFFGIAFHFLYQQPGTRAGIDFTATRLLRFAVALLGAQLTVAEIAHLGWWPVAIVCLAVPATLVSGLIGARLLGRSREEGVLAGGAVGICGASAAVSIAAVLPPTKESQRNTLFTVIGVTGLSTLAMIVYPTLAESLGLDATRAGIFLGATIHDVAQVVGAGYTLSQDAGDVATFVKLMRVALLLPTVALLWLLYQSRGRRASWGETTPPLPLFLLGFALLVAVNSFGVLPIVVQDGMQQVSRWCLVMAIAALGVKTSFQELMTLGWRPVALLVGNTLFLALLVLALLSGERFL